VIPFLRIEFIVAFISHSCARQYTGAET
jgi:hypothetical protein